MDNRKFLFWIILSICVFSFFNRSSYRKIDDIDPKLLNGPTLENPDNNYPIEISSGRLRFNLTPFKKCEINGLIVDKINHSIVQTFCPRTLLTTDWLSMNKCFTIMWGGNVGKKVYKSRGLTFYDGGVNWESEPVPNLNELARVALITKDKEVWNMIKSLSLGDQIKIKGTLMNLSYDFFGTPKEYKTGSSENNQQYWVIYPEDIRVLKKASVFFNYLFWISLLSLLALGIMRLFRPLKNIY